MRLRLRIAPGAGWRRLRSIALPLRLHQVGDLGEHAADRGRVLEHDRLADPPQPEAAQGVALARAAADAAAAERGLDHALAHARSSCTLLPRRDATRSGIRSSPSA